MFCPNIRSKQFKAYFWVDPEQSEPMWTFNTGLDSDWVHIPFEPLHPWEVPIALQDFIVVLRQCGDEEPLVVAGLKSGVALNMTHLRLLHAHYKFALPSKGKGSGKNGNVIKIDFVKALLECLFPDMTEEQKQDLIDGMMGKKMRHVQREAGKHSKSIVAAFNGLEQQDLKEFAKLTEVALDELQLENARDRQNRSSPVATASQQHETPAVLATLCPPVKGTLISRHPKLMRYQAFYLSMPTKERNSHLT